MSKETLDQAKSSLRDYVETITQRSKGDLYVCPLCGSGTGDHRTGAFSIGKSGTRWKCFSCGKSGDIYDLWQEINHRDRSEAAREVLAMYGPGTPAPIRTTPAQDFQPQQEQQPRDFSDEIGRYARALAGSEGERYLAGRGLTVDTMRRFNLGFDVSRRAVVIPYNPQGSYYGLRSVSDAGRRHNNLAGVQMPLFNAGALYDTSACFVVESPLCAISIAQAGAQAVAISGTQGKKRLLDQLKIKPTSAALILCMDNDEAGRRAAQDIGAELDALGVFCVNGTMAIMGDAQEEQEAEYRKDPNDVLQRSGADALKAAVKETASEAVRLQRMSDAEAEAERQKQTGAAMVDSFLQDIQTRKYEPMPTGIADIDRAIGGGFIRQQLVLLGAAPGAGKTALAQWIFEGMAKRGASCVYLNLEMSREQILARSFSRIAAAQGHSIRTTDILQGYRWTDEQRAAILTAAQEYKDTIAPRMAYNPDGVTANLDSIIAHIESEAQRAEKAGQPAPLVVVDYLQIVSGEPHEDAANVIKRAVMALKEYAMRHNTLVFVIVAHNRAANASGNVTMESGRDTSALEYSADLQLGLTFTKCLKRDGQKGKSPDELTEGERKQVTLRILKGRFGGMGKEVDLFFDGATMTYSQITREFAWPSTTERTPFDGVKWKSTGKPGEKELVPATNEPTVQQFHF